LRSKKRNFNADVSGGYSLTIEPPASIILRAKFAFARGYKFSTEQGSTATVGAFTLLTEKNLAPGSDAKLEELTGRFSSSISVASTVSSTSTPIPSAKEGIKLSVEINRVPKANAILFPFFNFRNR